MSVNIRGTCKSEEQRGVKGEPGLSIRKEIFNTSTQRQLESRMSQQMDH